MVYFISILFLFYVLFFPYQSSIFPYFNDYFFAIVNLSFWNKNSKKIVKKIVLAVIKTSGKIALK